LNGDANIVRQMYKAVAAADVNGFTALLDPDVEWTVPGSHDLAGSFKGISALLTHLAEVAQRTGGQVAVHLDEVLEGDRHTLAIVGVDMAVDGRTVHDQQVHLFELGNGLIRSVREFHGDQALFDDLFGTR
jgi:ketosteroid isomerase-like protein